MYVRKAKPFIQCKICNSELFVRNIVNRNSIHSQFPFEPNAGQL